MAWNTLGPASAEEIAQLIRGAPIDLPQSYLDHLSVLGGGEEDLGPERGFVQLWPAKDVVELNSRYDIKTFAPGFFGIGSNGGGELIALDTRHGVPFPVVLLSAVGMDAQEATLIAGSFEELRSQLNKN